MASSTSARKIRSRNLSFVAVILAAANLLGAADVRAGCVGPPYDEFDFWLGSWQDNNSSERYFVSRTADGCAILEVQYAGPGDDSAIIGTSIAGHDSTLNTWRELWVDSQGQVKLYSGGPQADGTFVLTTARSSDGQRWRFTYRNISAETLDADYALQSGDGAWTQVWATRYSRIGQTPNR